MAQGLLGMTQGVIAASLAFDTPEKRQLGMRVVFFRKDCNEHCGALQLIQVCYGTKHLDHDIGEHVGKYWIAVDAGLESPRRLHSAFAPGHPTRPYFYPPHIHRAEEHPDNIRLVDVVGAARRQQQLFCEAAAVCIRHQGGDHDSVIQAASYGWMDFGNVRLPRPNGAAGVLVEARGTVSPRFRSIVRREYPAYANGLIDW